MTAEEYLVGLVFFAGTVGTLMAAALLVTRRRLGHLDSTGRVLAWGLLTTAGLIGVHLLPGIVGVLSRTSALVLGAATLLAASRVGPGRAPVPATAPSRSPPSSPASTVIAVLAVTAVAIASLAAAWAGTATPSVEIDSLTFHLPNVAQYIQSASFWSADVFAPLQPTGHYPQNGDVVLMATVLPWDNDAFVRPMGLPFAALAGLSVYGIAVQLGSPRSTAALLGALFVSVPAFAIEAYEGAKTDPVMLATFGSGVYFLVAHVRSRLRADLVLAGLGLGLAFGTKWYALTSVTALLAVWVGVRLLGRDRWSKVLRHGAALAAGIALAGGFWMLRNLVESGNPVFPVRVAVLGFELFDAPRDFQRECAGFSVAGYLDSPQIWKDYFYPAYRAMLGLPGLVLALCWLVAVGTLVRSVWRRALDPEGGHAAPLLLTVSTALLALAYVSTPYSAFGLEGMPTQTIANVRWLMPTLLVCAACAAWAVGGLGRARIAAEVVLLLAVADGIRRGFSDPVGPVVVGAATLAAAVAAAGVLRGRSRSLAVGVAGLAVLAAAVVGYQRQEEFNSRRYADEDATFGWLARNAPAERRIGLAGLWDGSGISPVWPAFGPRLANQVEYVGRSPGGLLLEHGSQSAFLRDVERGDYDLLLVGKIKGDRDICPVPGSGTDENVWLRRLGFPRLAESRRFVLYRVPPSVRSIGRG